VFRPEYMKIFLYKNKFEMLKQLYDKITSLKSTDTDKNSEWFASIIDLVDDESDDDVFKVNLFKALFPVNALNFACSSGNLKLVKFLIDIETEIFGDEKYYETNQNFHVFNDINSGDFNLLDLCYVGGDWDMINFIKDKYNIESYGKYVILLLVLLNNLEMIEYIYQNDYNDDYVM